MTLSADISKWVEKAEGNVDFVVRQAVILAMQGIVSMSPVDTGRFRANWNLSEGVPNEATSTAVDPTGNLTIQRIMAQSQGVKAGKIYYLTNALPYAERLEHGWSKQAPQGMVRITAMDLPRRLEAIAARLQ